jgi:hypothetical protein
MNSVRERSGLFILAEDMLVFRHEDVLRALPFDLNGVYRIIQQINLSLSHTTPPFEQEVMHFRVAFPCSLTSRKLFQLSFSLYLMTNVMKQRSPLESNSCSSA